MEKWRQKLEGRDKRDRQRKMDKIEKRQKLRERTIQAGGRRLKRRKHKEEDEHSISI
jgi:hypothetical protein